MATANAGNNTKFKHRFLIKEADQRARTTIHPEFYYRFVFDRTKASERLGELGSM